MMANVRADIPATGRYIHMNTAGIGPTLQPVTDEIMRLYQLIGAHGYGIGAVKSEVEAGERLTRAALASLLHVDPEEVALVRSTSEAVSIVAFGLPLARGDEVIITDLENPACYLPWLVLRRQKGIAVRKLQLSGRDSSRKELILDRLEQLLSDRTRVIAVSHVTSRPGIKLPAEEICDMARRRGILVLFDGAQAAGCLDLDLSAMGCDFYASCAYKWMLGPAGTGFLYLRRSAMAQVDVTWTGSMAAESLDWETDEYSFWESAGRYEFGLRQAPLYCGYGKAVEFLAQLGTANVERRVNEIASYMKQELAKVPGVKVVTPIPRETSAGIVVAAVDGRTGEEMAESLFQRHRIVCVSVGGNQVRFSAGFYLTDEEVDSCIEAVRETLCKT